MSEGQSRAPERNITASGNHIADSKREFVRGRSIVRWAGLLCSAYFFVMPVYRHSFAVWMEFAVFYAAFLVLYFLAGELTGRRQTVAFVFFFLIAFLYYPLNQDAYALFVYPFAMLCLFLSSSAHLVPGARCDDGRSRGGDPIPGSPYCHSRKRPLLVRDHWAQ